MFAMSQTICSRSGIYLLNVAGNGITYLSAVDDDSRVVFSLVGDDRVIAAGPLLRIEQSEPKRAEVILNAALDFTVSELTIFARPQWRQRTCKHRQTDVN